MYVDPYGESAVETMGIWLETFVPVALIEPTPIGEVILGLGVIAIGVVIVIEFVANAVTGSLSRADEAPKSVTENEDNKETEKSKDNPKSLPTTSEPNSDQHLYDEDGLKQTRHYGPDGKAEYDIDYRHPGENHKFPHKHVWDWSKSDPRGPAIDIYYE